MSLLLIKNGRPVVKFSLGERTVIGRSTECDVHLLDPELSRQHVAIERGEDGSYRVRDLGSKNGTFVGGQKIEAEVRLTPGDEVLVGGQTFIFDPPVDVLHSRVGEKTVFMVVDESRASVPAEAEFTDQPEILSAGDLMDVYRLTRDVAAFLELDALLEKLVGGMAELYGADRVVLMSCGPEGRNIRPLAVKSATGKTAVSRTLLKRAVTISRPVLLDDALADVRLSHGQSVIEHQLRSVMLCPLLDGDRVMGCVQVDKAEKGAFGPKDLQKLWLLSQTAARALANARRFEALARRQGSDADKFIGRSASVQDLLKQVIKAAPSETRVLITGESGTGKELIARMIHRTSARADGPLVAVNCAALPESLVESELFGHEKGAFTGAVRRKKGCFELADNGTLFLDEVAELNPVMQAKLLRAVQENRFFRVGGEKAVQVDVRIVTATNRDLAARVKGNRFREDLYYRLNVIALHVPPLRERPKDIPLLAEHFLEKFARETGKPIPVLNPRALTRLVEYPWPGNVRELQNVIERIIVMGAGSEIQERDLPNEVRKREPRGVSGGLHEAVAALEKEMIGRALEASEGNKAAAARFLGISRPTLDKKISEYEL